MTSTPIHVLKISYVIIFINFFLITEPKIVPLFYSPDSILQGPAASWLSDTDWHKPSVQTPLQIKRAHAGTSGQHQLPS